MRKVRKQDIEGPWIRVCKTCGSGILYLNYQCWRQADVVNRDCRACADEAVRKTTRSKEYREAHSQTLKNVWNDENSVFNSQEYRKKLSDIQKIIQNRTEISKQKSTQMRNVWISRSSEEKLRIISLLNSSDSRERQRISIRQHYIDHPEARVEKSKIARKMMLDPEYKKRCTEKMIDAGVFNGGTSKKEKSLANFLLEHGFLTKQKIGSKRPDYLNPDTLTVIEFYGDFWHCDEKYTKLINERYSGIHPVSRETPDEIHTRDSKRVESFQKLGYRVIVIWEHEIPKDSSEINGFLLQKLSD